MSPIRAWDVLRTGAGGSRRPAGICRPAGLKTKRVISLRIYSPPEGESSVAKRGGEGIAMQRSPESSEILKNPPRVIVNSTLVLPKFVGRVNNAKGNLRWRLRSKPTICFSPGELSKVWRLRLQ